MYVCRWETDTGMTFFKWRKSRLRPGLIFFSTFRMSNNKLSLLKRVKALYKRLRAMDEDELSYHLCKFILWLVVANLILAALIDTP